MQLAVGCVSLWLGLLQLLLCLNTSRSMLRPNNVCPTPKDTDCFFLAYADKEKGLHFEGHRYYFAEEDCKKNSKCYCIEMKHGVVRDASMRNSAVYVHALYAVLVKNVSRKLTPGMDYKKALAWWCSKNSPFMWKTVYPAMMGGFFTACMPICACCVVVCCAFLPMCPMATWWTKRKLEIEEQDEEKKIKKEKRGKNDPSYDSDD